MMGHQHAIISRIIKSWPIIYNVLHQ
jgi:hypothetical protein